MSQASNAGQFGEEACASEAAAAPPSNSPPPYEATYRDNPGYVSDATAQYPPAYVEKPISAVYPNGAGYPSALPGGAGYPPAPPYSHGAAPGTSYDAFIHPPPGPGYICPPPGNYVGPAGPGTYPAPSGLYPRPPGLYPGPPMAFISPQQQQQPNGYGASNNPQPFVYVPPTPLSDPPQDYMAYSLFVTVCCCWVLGLFAVARSAECRTAIRMGNRVEAQQKARQAKRYAHMGFAFGVVCVASAAAILGVYYGLMLNRRY